MSETASRNFDVQARSVREKICFDRLCAATGSQDGQNAFLGKAPSILNCWVARFGGKAHIESPADGISEKVVIQLRYVERAEIESLISKMLNALPIESESGIWYFGPRVKYCPDMPEIVEVPFEIGSQKVDGFAADLELFACMSLKPAT